MRISFGFLKTFLTFKNIISDLQKGWLTENSGFISHHSSQLPPGVAWESELVLFTLLFLFLVSTSLALLLLHGQLLPCLLWRLLVLLPWCYQLPPSPWPLWPFGKKAPSSASWDLLSLFREFLISRAVKPLGTLLFHFTPELSFLPHKGYKVKEVIWKGSGSDHS